MKCKSLDLLTKAQANPNDQNWLGIICTFLLVISVCVLVPYNFVNQISQVSTTTNMYLTPPTDSYEITTSGFFNNVIVNNVTYTAGSTFKFTINSMPLMIISYSGMMNFTLPGCKFQWIGDTGYRLVDLILTPTILETAGVNSTLITITSGEKHLATCQGCGIISFSISRITTFLATRPTYSTIGLLMGAGGILGGLVSIMGFIYQMFFKLCKSRIGKSEKEFKQDIELPSV